MGRDERVDEHVDGHVEGHVDEATVHAWLDGALAPDEAARVAAHVEGCAACAAVVAEARGLIAASSRILSALDHVPADVVPVRRRAVAWYRGWPVRVAASVVVAVVGGLVVADQMHLIAPMARQEVPTVAAPTVAAPTVAAPTVAAPTVAAPTVAAPTVAAPTVAAPTVAAPTVAAPAGATPAPSASQSVGARVPDSVRPQPKATASAQAMRGVRVVAPAVAETTKLVFGSTVRVAPAKTPADEATAPQADSVAPRLSTRGANEAAPAAAPAPAPALAPAPAPAAAPAPPRVLRQLMRGAGALQSQVMTSVAAKQAGDSIARAGCYDVVAPVTAALPRRIVLDTTSVGDSGLVRRVARVAPADSARAAYWVAPAPDSVEVVIFDGPTLAGRVTSRGWSGAAAGQPFTARRCGPR